MKIKKRTCHNFNRIFIILILSSLIYTTQNINAQSTVSSSDDYWGLHKHRFYGFGAPSPFPTPQELSEMGVNLLNQMPGTSIIRSRLHAGKELSGPEYGRLLQKIKKHKDLGINIHAGIAGLVPIRFDKGKEIPDEMSKHFVIDASGNPYPDKTDHGRREFWICLNHDYWISYISDIMVALANAGMASIHMDAAQVSVCYCSVCKKKWSAYVKNKTGQDISIAEASRRDGPPKITTYYAMYRYQCVIDFLRKAIKEVKKINPNFGIETTNHMKDRSYYFWINGRDVFDIACLEIDTYCTNYFPPLAEALTSYRLCLAAMGKGKTAWALNKNTRPASEAVKPGISFEDASTLGTWVAPERRQYLNASKDRLKLYMAQPLIEGIMVCPSPLGTSHARENQTTIIPYYDVIGDYYNFQKYLQDDLINSKSTSKIAVVFSVVNELYYSTKSIRHRPSWHMYGVTRALLKKQYEYDVRVLEFPEEIDIDQYDIFILPHAESISKKGRAFFSQLQEKEDKKIIVFSKIGLRDEDYNDTKEVKLSEHVISLNLSPNEWLGHINTVDLAEQEKAFINIIKQHNSKIIQINSEHSEKIITVTRKLPGGLMIHLLNFYIDTHLQLPEHEQLKKDKAHIFENLSITLNLPQKKEIENIISLSPDSKLNVECNFKKNNNGEIELTVPRLEVWTVIKIKYKVY